MSLPSETITFGDMIRDLLLAMVSSQNEANKNFIAGVEDLAGETITISYTKNVGGKEEKREIKGSALAFGITPALLTIQSGIIEIRTAMSVAKNSSPSGTSSSKLKSRAGYLFRNDTVDAKYQNTYSYKAEASSLVRITVAPTPPTAALMEAIKEVTKGSALTDSAKP